MSETVVLFSSILAGAECLYHNIAVSDLLELHCLVQEAVPAGSSNMCLWTALAALAGEMLVNDSVRFWRYFTSMTET